ncbi:anti-sigma-factor antagonist [Skermanella stibiiresistens SB22]|uniref:Anti-sigma-factor antagonist n=1 Tax=Skermanella stibiiresistens SB22 TaxID=1385369 RepID=W9H061_9PROT|nr:STAS domain-containing protein [Skermanella stibiiresistens]EWY39575.1 anti-sigma-factor antagonist [Skermanella stibiiresistens SB22]
MNFDIEKKTGKTEIALIGRITFADHDDFRNVINVFEGEEGHEIVFDLSRLDFVDSSGLGMFIIARDTARKKKLSFSIRGARNDVMRVMQVAKFHKMFTIVD